MKHVALITLHHVLNYGSVLQTFALAKKLELLGHRATVIDYITRTHRFTQVVVGSKAQHGYLAGALLSLSILPKFLISRLRFNAFIARYLHLTPRRYLSLQALQAQPPAADVYLTGSDQVWNSGYNAGIDPAFFLDFGPAAIRRVAYAASFGKTQLDTAELARTQALLARYDALGMRESSAVELLQSMGYSDVTHVLDPTLLLSREQWERFVPPSRLGRGERYILIHCVNKECRAPLLEFARRLQQKTGCKIRSTVAMNANTGGRLKGALLGWHRRTEDFLGLVSHASYVVADSFHGTVFSILFNRPFIVMLPPRYSTRLTSLLQLLGIPERMAGMDNATLEQIEQPIDYTSVNARLAVEREKSIRYLKLAIDGPP
jgi:hypothetical protein